MRRLWGAELPLPHHLGGRRGGRGAPISETIGSLREQLEAMRERLRSVFATASDLIDANDIDDVLARIAERAAVEVRAPRYLLAVRTEAGRPGPLPPQGI